MPNIVLGGSTPSDGFELKSLRFDRPSGDYMSRTFISDGGEGQRLWTFSCWFKVADPEVADTSVGHRRLFGIGYANNNTQTLELGLNQNNKLMATSWTNNFRITTQVFRDPAAWYHVIYIMDTRNPTADDRMRIYVNGERVTAFDTNYTLTKDEQYGIGLNQVHYVGYGGHGTASAYCWDGYMSEVYFCSQVAHGPEFFGETDIDTGQWVPKNPVDIKAAVNFGVNGFYLPFSNDSLKLNNTFSDEDYHVPHTSLTAVGTAHTDTAVKKFGTASLQLDGDSDYLRVPDHEDWNLGSGDFTIEAWVYNATASGTQRLFSHTSHAVNGKKGWNVFLTSDSTGRFTWSTNGTDEHYWGFANCMTQNTWTHFALTRSGTQLRVFKNGIMVDASVDSDMTTIWNSPRDLLIGAFEENDSTLSGYWNGYIDEVRISKVNRYSGGVFDPGAAYTADKDTALLLHMDGSNGGTTFTDSSWTGVGGKGHEITVGGTVVNQRVTTMPVTSSGNAHIIGPKFGSSCIVFDGDEDYLSIADHADWAFGSGSFTVDFWANQIGAWEDDAFLWQQHADTNNFAGVRIRTSGDITLMARVGGSYTINLDFGSVAMPRDEWFHFALVRNTSGTNRFEVYINGTLQQTINNTTAWPDIAGAFVIGDDLYNSGKEFTGYMDEFRVSNVARYTADFTPATAAYSSDSNTKLLIHSNTTMGSTTFDDSGATDHTITANGAVKHIAPKIGTGMMALDGTDDYISLPKEAMWTRWGDWTIEGWWYFREDTSAVLCEQGTNNSNALQMWWNGSDKLQVYIDNDGSSWSFNTTGNTTLTINTWMHIALVRNGNNIRLYINGTLDTAFASTTFTTEMNNSSDVIRIGETRTGSDETNGYVDEFRISWVARYTSNFTPSTTAFKSDRHTKVLLHMDSTSEGTYFPNDTEDGIFYTDGTLTQKSMIDIGGGTNYLTAPVSDDWDFGTGDYTLEMWMRTDGIWDGSESGLISNHSSPNGWQWVFDGANSNSTGHFEMWATDQSEYQSKTVTIHPLYWHHMAVSRKNNVLYHWLDGNPIGFNAFTETMGETDTTLQVFAYNYNGTGAIRSGNFDQIRVSKGVCRYSGEFTSPAAAFTNDSNTNLLLHMDGSNGGTTFTDSSTGNHSVTVSGDAHTDTGQKKFGTASAQFDGSDQLSLANHADFNLGTEDFTIELWARFDNVSTNNQQLLFKRNVTYTGDYVLWWSSSNGLVWTSGTSGSGADVSQGSTSGWANDTWYHIAVVKAGGILTAYRNGVPLFSTSDTRDYDNTGNLFIGSSSGSGYFTGYIDEVRISKGTVRYVSFTPPTALFTADANTKLLIQSDYNEADVGSDDSGNYNKWTPNNQTVHDSTHDAPNNNFCTVNPLSFARHGDRTSRTASATQGNLRWTSTNSHTVFSSTMAIPPNTGKYYWEMCDIGNAGVGNHSNFCWGIGLMPVNDGPNTAGYLGINNSGGNELGAWYVKSNHNVGTVRNYGGGATAENRTAPTLGAGNHVYKCCYDSDAGKFYLGGDLGWMGRDSNGVGNLHTGTFPTSSQYTFEFNPNDKTVTPAYHAYQATSFSNNQMNFGQDATFSNSVKGTPGYFSDENGYGEFYYEPPSGYVALCSNNLASASITKPEEHFDIKLHTGTGSGVTVTGLEFQPDLIWGKGRSTSTDHVLVDAVRGIGKWMGSNRYQSEDDSTTESYSAFTSDGFTTGSGSMSQNTQTYVNWCWEANGAGSSNSDGSITSTVSANTAAGFSIVAWAGTGSNATVGHGLSQAPELIFNKSRTGNTSTHQWAVQSKLWNSASDTNMLYLNGTAGRSDDTNVFQAAPTATVFSPQGGGWGGIGTSGHNYIAYCWHSVEGYSKIGMYKGNGHADGAFVYCGFRPRMVLIKRTDGTQDWMLGDTAINPYNVTTHMLRPAQNAVAQSGNTIDILSNGFKSRLTGNAFNASEVYLYMAFAEEPFKTSNAR